MELILSRPGMIRTFNTEWKLKWVPAIIGYCRNLKKKEICEILSTRSDPSGEYCNKGTYLITVYNI